MRSLFFHTNRREGRFRPTWDFVEATQQELNWERMDTDLNDKEGYGKRIREVWGSDDLLWLEEDKVPTGTIIDEIMECENPVCSQLYTYPRYDAGFKKWLPPVIGGVWKFFENHLGYWDRRPLFDGEQYGDFMDLGLIKIKKDAMKEELPRHCVEFGTDNFQISDYFMQHRIKIHAHRPVMRHNHIKETNFNVDYSIPSNPIEFLTQ